MKGSMRERKPGVWELIVQLPRDPLTGKARQMSRSVHGTKRDAQRSLAALVKEVDQERLTSSGDSVSALLKAWLEMKSRDLSPTTAREYERLTKTLIAPALGNLALKDVSARRLDAFYAALLDRKSLSASSVRQVHAILRGAFAQAVRWGWISRNPAVDASPPKIRRKEITPPDMQDARRLLLAADEYDPDFGALLRVLTATGARRGEVCGLRWSDIKLDEGSMAIRRSVATVAGGTVEKDTKTHAARRIALDEATIAVLRNHRRRMDERAFVALTELDAKAFVFTESADGSKPLHPDTITGAFRRLCKRAGLTGVRLHDLRHFHATQLLAAGVPVPTVSGRLGHANASTTLNVYAHFLEASDQEAASMVGLLLDADPKRGKKALRAASEIKRARGRSAD